MKNIITKKACGYSAALLINKALFFCALLGIGACDKKEQQSIQVNSNSAKESQDETKATTIKIMTFNQHIKSPSTIANVIKAQNPDLVALQEVDVNTNRSGATVNQAAQVASLCGMNYIFAKALDFDGGQYGNAVLSKYPIYSSSTYFLPAGTGERRSMGLIQVIVDGKNFNFGSTHLDNRSETTRLAQVDELNRIISSKIYPTSMAGDYNATPSSATITRQKQTMTLGCLGSCPYTHPASFPTSCIDYFFFKPNMFNVLTYNTVNTTVSDHRPVVATITLR